MTVNPFAPADKDRAVIWEMLVTRDIRAFVAEDWSMIENDFISKAFLGIDGRHTCNPDGWTLAFADLDAYKAEWLRQASAFKKDNAYEHAGKILHEATVLRDIEINGDMALAHKKFIWDFLRLKGEKAPANWQSIYHCRRVDDVWKIAGFTGYLPYLTGSDKNERRGEPAIQVPEQAAQHKTSGPYSPVLIVNPGRLVVISGQAAIDMEGKIIGETIEEQAAFTLDNCRRQLAVAGCGLDKVFKVTVFLKEMEHWARFNEVYRNYFAGTMPVRTTVQAGLLSTLLVEIECWATV